MYKKVFEGGRAMRGSPLTLRFIRIEQDCTRVGFIIRKKAGNAPMRNSIRRTLRSSFQEILPAFAEGTWLIFDVSEKASKFPRAHIKGEADRLLRELAAAQAAP
jgi:ribonuclease P protein component